MKLQHQSFREVDTWKKGKKT